MGDEEAIAGAGNSIDERRAFLGAIKVERILSKISKPRDMFLVHFDALLNILFSSQKTYSVGFGVEIGLLVEVGNGRNPSSLCYVVSFRAHTWAVPAVRTLYNFEATLSKSTGLRNPGNYVLLFPLVLPGSLRPLGGDEMGRLTL